MNGPSASASASAPAVRSGSYAPRRPPNANFPPQGPSTTFGGVAHAPRGPANGDGHSAAGHGVGDFGGDAGRSSFGGHPQQAGPGGHGYGYNRDQPLRPEVHGSYAGAIPPGPGLVSVPNSGNSGANANANANGNGNAPSFPSTATSSAPAMFAHPSSASSPHGNPPPPVPAPQTNGRSAGAGAGAGAPPSSSAGATAPESAPAAVPLPSGTKTYRPYFSPAEIEHMSAKQRGKMSVGREERARQQACGFIDAVGSRCGFPRKTIATAQTLYMRFHLFFPYRDFNYVEVCLSTLYVASKLHDTLKKPREIILASYPLRFPHLVKQGSGGAGVDPAAVDAHALEAERGRVLGIERLVLEGVCFMFGVEGVDGVIRFARAMGLSKDMSQRAWRVCVDSHRTLAPLSCPPHVIALGSLYVCALLSLEKPRPDAAGDSETDNAKVWREVVETLGSSGEWEERWSASAAGVDAVAHAVIDLHITILSTPPTDPQHALTPSPSSPREPARSGAANAASGGGGVNTIGNTAYRPGAVWTLGALTELKVFLRERSPARSAIGDGWVGGEAGGIGGAEAAGGEGVRDAGPGRNDATTRFVWDGVVVV